VALVEIVIDLEVDLLPRERVGTIQAFVIESKNAFVAVLFGANPAMTGGIQAVADLVVVG
jgi:hypothetical protein